MFTGDSGMEKDCLRRYFSKIEPQNKIQVELGRYDGDSVRQVNQ